MLKHHERVLAADGRLSISTVVFGGGARVQLDGPLIQDCISQLWLLLGRLPGVKLSVRVLFCIHIHMLMCSSIFTLWEQALLGVL
jgi:hypothetical protein